MNLTVDVLYKFHFIPTRLRFNQNTCMFVINAFIYITGRYVD